MALEAKLPLVILVDDVPEITSAMADLLQRYRYQTQAFRSAEALLQNGVPAEARCLVLDVSMPGGMDGLAMLERLRQQGETVPALVVSGAGDIRMAVRALRAGAFDFIEKPYSAQQLLDAVAACSAQRAPVAAPVEANGLEKLTRRERQVMEAILQGQSSKEIAHVLGISVRTVEIHRGHLKEKLGARNLAEVVRIAFAAGIGNSAENAGAAPAAGPKRG